MKTVFRIKHLFSIMGAIFRNYIFDLQNWHKISYHSDNYPVCMEWDAKLNDLMDEFDANAGYAIMDSEFTITINGVAIWIGNFPYSYGRESYSSDGALPARKTRFRLRKFVARTWGKATYD